MSNIKIFLIILIIIIICTIIYLFSLNEKFTPYPDNQTPLTNYNKIILKINELNKWKNEFSSGINPVITTKCDTHTNESDCIGNNCNWYGNVCSSMYSNLY